MKLLILSIFIPFLGSSLLAQEGGMDSVDTVVLTVDTAHLAIDSSHFALIDSVLSLARTYLGTPYQYGSTSTRTFDCSGFVSYVYGKYGVELPHSSGAIWALCEKISLDEVQPGDLLFFKGRSIASSRIGHVSLVLFRDEKGIHIIHATHRGVTIDVFEESEYYTKRFLHIGRLRKTTISG